MFVAELSALSMSKTLALTLAVLVMAYFVLVRVTVMVTVALCPEASVPKEQVTTPFLLLHDPSVLVAEPKLT